MELASALATNYSTSRRHKRPAVSTGRARAFCVGKKRAFISAGSTRTYMHDVAFHVRAQPLTPTRELLYLFLPVRPTGKVVSKCAGRAVHAISFLPLTRLPAHSANQRNKRTKEKTKRRMRNRSTKSTTLVMPTRRERYGVIIRTPRRTTYSADLPFDAAAEPAPLFTRPDFVFFFTAHQKDLA